MSYAARGPMVIVDASCLYAVLARRHEANRIRARLDREADYSAPHIIDVEVLGVIRRDFLRGYLDRTAAHLAIEELRDWPGERFGHRPLLERAWELRSTVRGWDAMYVALAEAFDAPLLTTDARLAHASGPRCTIEVLSEAQ
jgi:predicted nucleic acid-binding protein